MFDCFIFDADGTLFDTREANLAGLRRLLLEEKGINFTAEQMSAEFGRPGHQTLADFGFDDIQAAIIRWNVYLRQSGHTTSPFDGVRDTLAALKASGKYIGIVTSRRHDELEPDLRLFGLEALVDLVVCSDDTLRHKPDPEPLLKFFELSPVAKERTIFIGDMECDSQCAAATGTAFGLAAWGEVVDMPYLHRFAHPKEVMDLA